jgi:molybdenum cofactor cytidylyltransferase
LVGSPHIAAIVLAAGRSTRMGAANKLTADVGGKPMARRVVEAASASAASPVLVVTGHQAADVRAALAGLTVAFVDNPDYAVGLSSSLKAGIRAVPPTADGALVLLGDMPQITAAHLDRLIAAFSAEGGAGIVVPTHQGRRGNPVLWPRACFGEMLQLEGDAGARRLFAAHTGRIREVQLDTDAIFADVDTPEALAQLRAGRQKGSDPSPQT